eukprot:EG_transcript_10656
MTLARGGCPPRASALALAALKREHLRSLAPDRLAPEPQKPAHTMSGESKHQTYFDLLRAQYQDHQKAIVTPEPTDPHPVPHLAAEMVAVSPPHTPRTAAVGGWSPFQGPQWLTTP